VVGVYAWIIYAVSAMSFDSQMFRSAQKFHVDWLVHVVEYSLFGFLLARAFGRVLESKTGRRILLAALMLGALYAVSDEWHQRSVPTRDASVHDAVADMIGLALGAVIYLRMKGKSLHA
jgi:VanZ family protein